MHTQHAHAYYPSIAALIKKAVSADRVYDIFLVLDDQCTVQGSQRVFLSAFDGALLSIADAVPLFTDAAGVQLQAPALRLGVTRGEFTLSGGRADARDVLSAGYERQGRQSIARAARRVT